MKGVSQKVYAHGSKTRSYKCHITAKHTCMFKHSKNRYCVP